jgi:hypothetical protein
MKGKCHNRRNSLLVVWAKENNITKDQYSTTNFG